MSFGISIAFCIVAFGSLSLGAAFQHLRMRKTLLRGEEAQKIIDNTPAHIWRQDSRGNFTYSNPALETYLGDRARYLKTKTVNVNDAAVIERQRRTTHPDDMEELRSRWINCLETGLPFYQQHRLRTANDSYRWVQSSIVPERSSRGEIVAWNGTHTDIDALKQTEALLRARESEFREMIDALPVMIWATETDKGTTFFNRTLLDYTGYRLEDIQGRSSDLGRTLAGIAHSDDEHGLETNIAKSLQTGTVHSFRFRIRRTDGVYRWVESRTAAALTSEIGIARQYGVLFDVHDEIVSGESLRVVQDQLTKASQVASLSQVSASIAHELSQPLAALVANSAASRAWLDHDPPNIERARQTADFIARDANSAADVVDRIRTLFNERATGQKIEVK